MILFGAPYYCLELYIAYTGRKPSDLVLALAGGAAVAPSSIDPWIFLLFWVNWSEPSNVSISSSRRLITLTLQQQQCIQSRRVNRSNTMATSSISDPIQHHVLLYPNTTRLLPYTVRSNIPVRKLGTF
jgi:hypothetical protein